MTETNGHDVANQPPLSPENAEIIKLSRKDFVSDQEVRWCPGCGDYSILAAMQLLFAEMGVRPENLVFVSGIGCAARFPYYMETYGIHSIHGRAPAVATGVALARPDLDVWVIGGDFVARATADAEHALGQLLLLVRARFLVDAIGYDRVRGKPFRIAEIVAEAERVLGEVD